MRRSRQALSQEECLEVLDRTTSGVLALSDSRLGFPIRYLSAMCAATGGCCSTVRCPVTSWLFAQLDLRERQLQLCVVDADDVVPESLTTYFGKFILLGHIRVIEDTRAR